MDRNLSLRYISKTQDDLYQQFRTHHITITNNSLQQVTVSYEMNIRSKI